MPAGAADLLFGANWGGSEVGDAHKIRMVEKVLVQQGAGDSRASRAAGGVLVVADAAASSGGCATVLDARGQEGGGAEREKLDEWLDDAQLQRLSSSDLEGLMDQFLLRVVQQLVNLASVDEDLVAGEELNGLDSR